MATTPIPAGTKTIGINLHEKMADELEQRAASMHIATGKYCKLILKQWLDSNQKLKLQEK